MNAIFSATNASATLSGAALEIGGFVVVLLGMLAGLHLTLSWFKRGVEMIEKGEL